LTDRPVAQMERKGAASAATVLSLRDDPQNMNRPRDADSAPPPWVALGLHELLALRHGLTGAQDHAWMDLVAEALSDGLDTLPLERCREVAGKVWISLEARLIRTHRIAIEADSVRLIWVAEKLADARKRIAKAKKMRSGHENK